MWEKLDLTFFYFIRVGSKGAGLTIIIIEESNQCSSFFFGNTFEQIKQVFIVSLFLFWLLVCCQALFQYFLHNNQVLRIQCKHSLIKLINKTQINLSKNIQPFRFSSYIWSDVFLIYSCHYDTKCVFWSIKPYKIFKEIYSGVFITLSNIYDEEINIYRCKKSMDG